MMQPDRERAWGNAKNGTPSGVSFLKRVFPRAAGAPLIPDARRNAAQA
jgi:hypothetical protein